MIPFSSYIDLTGKKREIGGGYHGRHSRVLEARIFSEQGSELEVGVSLGPKDVVNHRFNPQTNSLDVFYNDPGLVFRAVALYKFQGSCFYKGNKCL